jgi:2-dehydro-3-deoxyphosphooctonate aldolase (KDO 8-P synthase)
MRNSAKKVFSTGNENVLLCERGSTFGYSDLVVDMRNIPLMRDAGCPIVADVTHSLQQPAGLAGADGAVASGGSRELIPTIARSCVAAGVDGLFMEVHNDPNSSPVDGPTQWPLRHFPELLAELKAIALATKARTGHNAQLDLTPMNIM